MSSNWIIEGKYRVIGEIGKGGMGMVFLGYDMLLHRKVAIKFLLPEYSKNLKIVNSFLNEAKVMAKVVHPNVAQIYSLGCIGEDQYYFVMEYIEGEGLEEKINVYVRRQEYMPLIEILKIMIDICKGLSAIHKEGIAHRDIKPGNIIIDEVKNRAVIMDFGLGVNIEEIRSSIQNKQLLVGTPAYMAPEIIRGKDLKPNQLFLADIYSLGVTFYEMVTGCLPFKCDNYAEILIAHTNEIPTPPSMQRVGLLEAIDKIVLKCLAKEPQERYQNCEQLLEDLYSVYMVEYGNIVSKRTATDRGKLTPSKIELSNRQSKTPIGRVKVFIVSKDIEFRNHIYELIKSVYPYSKLYSFSSGWMCIDKVGEVIPDLVIFSMKLDDMNGIEFLGTIRSELMNQLGSNIGNITFIAISSYGSEKDKEILRQLGVKEFIIMPIDPQEFLEKIRHLFEMQN